MMRMSTKNDVLPPQNGEKKWELRPGGMLVQKRTEAEENTVQPPLTIRVRVKYGSIYHEIHVNSQATFGELKKLLSGPTGLHHQDQKLFYKDKERDSKMFLDSVGVKDKSKLVVEEDPISKEKRFIEMKKNAKKERAAKTISEISFEVDRLAGRVSAFESIISKGGKVVEKDLVTLTESLMNQLLRLDGIDADGDVKLQRKLQVTRVQKYVETLDFLKVKNSAPTSNGANIPSKPQQQPTPTAPRQPQSQSNGSAYSPVHQRKYSNGSVSSPVQNQERRHSFGQSLMDSPVKEQQPSRHSASGSDVVITTQWETFDAAPGPQHGATPTSSSTHRAQPSFTWDLL